MVFSTSFYTQIVSSFHVKETLRKKLVSHLFEVLIIPQQPFYWEFYGLLNIDIVQNPCLFFIGSSINWSIDIVQNHLSFVTLY